MHIDDYIDQGIYIGMVGARFERSKVMEHSIMCVTRRQNNDIKLGYGEQPKTNNHVLSLWKQFYNCDYLPTFNDVKNILSNSHSHSLHPRYEIM